MKKNQTMTNATRLKIFCLKLWWCFFDALVTLFLPWKKDHHPPKSLLRVIPEGFIFGKKAGRYLIKPDDIDGHILVIGGAGSGKSSCLGIPAVL